MVDADSWHTDDSKWKAEQLGLCNSNNIYPFYRLGLNKMESIYLWSFLCFLKLDFFLKLVIHTLHLKVFPTDFFNGSNFSFFVDVGLGVGLSINILCNFIIALFKIDAISFLNGDSSKFLWGSWKDAPFLVSVCGSSCCKSEKAVAHSCDGKTHQDL